MQDDTVSKASVRGYTTVREKEVFTWGKPEKLAIWIKYRKKA